jgi:lipopolysaccharide/colanic/teichoic acid biosynthesis glycosyltransferase
MSLVGPRPLLMEYLDHYTPVERRRHEMRPGITGWAAVNGRHTVRFEDRLLLDAWYVDHWSVWLDVRIIATTLAQVLRREGVAVTQGDGEIDFPERFLVALQHGDGLAEGRRT